MKTFLHLRRWGLLAGLLLGLLSTGQAWSMDPFSHIVVTPRQETYQQLNGGTVVSLVQADDTVSAGLPIGFDFKLDGNSYTTVYASSNGFLSFNPNLSSTRDNDFDLLSGDSQPMLAPLWDDLDGSSGTASYRTTGAVGSRVFTFEWRNWKWNRVAASPNISFQVRLYEGSGRFEYAYNNVGSAAVTGDGASIGFISNYKYLSLTDTSPNPGREFMTSTNNLTTPPASGQVYAFVPPTPPANDECTGAIAITVGASNNLCGNAVNASNLNATRSGASVPSACGQDSDTWYSFVAPAGGSAQVSVTTDNGGNLEVFSGSCGSLTSVYCNGLNFGGGNQVSGLTPGATYYIRLVINNNEAPFSICVNALEAEPTMTNDECATAILLPVSTGGCNPINGTLNGATKSADAAPTCSSFWVQRSYADVWYRFVVPASGNAIVRTSAGTAVNAASSVALSVYSGSCGNLTEVGCNVYNGSAFFGTVGVYGRTPGEVLYARVWEENTNSFGICVSDGTPGDLVINTLNRTINGDTYRNITITGTGSAQLTGSPTVTNALLLQGELDLNTRTVGGTGSFTSQAGSSLLLQNAGGLSASGATGAVQVNGARSFSDDATYSYRVSTGYVAGTGLPSTVRELYVNTDVDFNFDSGQAPGPGELTLSNPLSVRRRLRLKRNLVTSSANMLTLLSTPTQGTALIYNEGADLFVTTDIPGAVVGPARVQRAIDPSLNAGLGYRHYSAPVTGSTVADLAATGFSPVVNPAYNAAAEPNLVTPFPTVFGYDESRLATVTSNYGPFDKGWVSPASTTDALTVGRGYTVNIGSSALVDFEGTPVTGDQTVTLTRGSSADAGWALVGNPYPSPIDWSQALIPSGMSAAAYVYESTGRYAGQYRSYVNGIGNPIIASGQGFFVRHVGTAGSTIDFTFDNFMRQTTFSTGTTFRRGAAERRPLVQLSLQGGAAGLADEATVYFDQAATAATDARTDAFKLRNPGGQAPNLFSLVGAAELAINGLGLPTGSAAIEVPLGLQVPAAGSYTIAAEQLLNLTSAGLTNVVLEDRRSGQRTALSQAGASYTFQLAATELTSLGRFVLVFNPSTAPLAANASALAQQLGVYPNPAHGRFTLSVPALPGTPVVQATLRNQLGQVVLPARRLSLSAAGAVAEFETAQLAAGVYLLQLSAEGIAPVVRRVVIE